MTIGRREYEERYGEEVGTCSIHKITVVDRTCPQCEDDMDIIAENTICNCTKDICNEDTCPCMNIPCGDEEEICENPRGCLEDCTCNRIIDGKYGRYHSRLGSVLPEQIYSGGVRDA